MESEKVTKRLGSLIKLRPEFEEQYIKLHRQVFPKVLDRIMKSNIRNYSVFLHNNILFSYYEYIGNNYNADMKAIADSTTKAWWKLTDPMQEPLLTRKESEWWAEMEQFLSLKKIIKHSEKVQRIGLVAEIIPDKEEKIKHICQRFSSSLEEETIKENFQNCSLFHKDENVYNYYEYVGDDFKKSLDKISKNEIFKLFQSEINKFLVLKDNGYWQVMKEIFHLD